MELNTTKRSSACCLAQQYSWMFHPPCTFTDSDVAIASSDRESISPSRSTIAVCSTPRRGGWRDRYASRHFSSAFLFDASTA